jgi:hypothetical protein
MDRITALGLALVAMSAACDSDADTSLTETGGAGPSTVGSGREPCPVVGGRDGTGVCEPWKFGSWERDCTQGYTLVRTCEAGFDCNETDHAACNAPLPSGDAPEGCPACGACVPACQDKACGVDDGCGAACLQGSGCNANAEGLAYFGYWRDTYFAGSWMVETQTHANFTMVEDGTYESLLPEAATHGVTVLLTPPAQESWAAAQAVIAPYANRIIAYNLLDDADVQPDWNAAKANVESYATLIHGTYPGAHLYINLAGHFRDIPDFTLPAGVDWVGLECYAGVADCDDMVTKLSPKLPPGGRVWIMPPGETGYGSEPWLVSTAQEMYDWALTRPVILGINVFVWETELLLDANYNGELATRDLPELRLKSCQIARTITGRGQPSACP